MDRNSIFSGICGIFEEGMDSCGLLWKVSGGEGGIRTPDSLSTMPDFESGAFNRALPPLRLLNSLPNQAIRKRVAGSFIVTELNCGRFCGKPRSKLLLFTMEAKAAMLGC